MDCLPGQRSGCHREVAAGSRSTVLYFIYSDMIVRFWTILCVNWGTIWGCTEGRGQLKKIPLGCHEKKKVKTNHFESLNVFFSLARELCFTGRRFTAEEAMKFGFVRYILEWNCLLIVLNALILVIQGSNPVMGNIVACENSRSPPLPLRLLWAKKDGCFCRLG